MQSGRWLRDSDRLLHNRAAVHRPRSRSGVRGDREERSGPSVSAGKDYGVVGVLGSVELDPSLDNAVFVTQWAAKHDFETEGKPTKLYVRALDGTTQATSDAIPTAIHLGGPDQVATKIPSDALAGVGSGRRDAPADRRLRRDPRPPRRRHRHRQRHVDLRHPALDRDRHPPRPRAHAVEDRDPVPARGAVRRHPRRDRRRRCSGCSSSTSCPRSPTGWSSSTTGRMPLWVGLARRRVRARRPLPVGQGRPPRAPGDPPPGLKYPY